MAGVVFKLPAWLFVMLLLTGICIVPFTFELFIEFCLISTFAFPNTCPVLLLCISRTPSPPWDSRGNTGSCTSYSLHFSTSVGGVYTPSLAPGVKRGGHYCGQRYLFSRGIFCNISIPSCSKEICFAKCLIVESSSVASYYVSYFSSYKWPFCLITLYDVFIRWK